MQTRKERRAAERAAFEAALKQARERYGPKEPVSTSPQISEARAAANRSNAQLSSGPRTPEGKAITSQNAFKHGLYSRQLVMLGEDPAKLDALRTDLLAEHQPQSETERLLINEMADQYWRLQRARRMEAILLNDDPKFTHLAAAQRMMASAERGFYKALKTLTELQKARGFVPQKLEKQQPAVKQQALGSVPQTAQAESTNAIGSVSQIAAPQSAMAPPSNPQLRGSEPEKAAA